MDHTAPILTPGKVSRREWLRFMKGVALGHPCLCTNGKPHQHWLWQRGKAGRGYGRFFWRGKDYYAHRFACIALGRRIAEWMQCDHKCRIHPCVNPLCIDLVSAQINALRGMGFPAVNARKTQCPLGHKYDEENTIHSKRGQRSCRICKRKSDTIYRQTKRLKKDGHRPGYYRTRKNTLRTQGRCHRHVTQLLLPGRSVCQQCLDRRPKRHTKGTAHA